MSSIYVFRHTITGIKISFHGVAENLFIRSIYENLMFCRNGLLHTISPLSSLKHYIIFWRISERKTAAKTGIPPTTYRSRDFLPWGVDEDNGRNHKD